MAHILKYRPRNRNHRSRTAWRKHHHASHEKRQGCDIDSIDKFVDGVCRSVIGEKTFTSLQFVVDKISLVPEGKVCAKPF
ncbi:hypothetical protein ACEQPO_16685 [Bacillus sp. SL00103]